MRFENSPRITPKASSFAAYISRTLSAAGFDLVPHNAGASREGIRVRATTAKFSGLPTATVTLNFPAAREENSFSFKAMQLNIVKVLQDADFWIVENTDEGVIRVAPCFVQVVSVSSSTSLREDYLVRVENGIATLCGCRGYAYRLTCRHLAEAEAKVLEPARGSISGRG